MGITIIKTTLSVLFFQELPTLATDGNSESIVLNVETIRTYQTSKGVQLALPACNIPPTTEGV